MRPAAGTTTDAGASSGASDALVLEDVTVAYGKRVVLKGVSAWIERGQVVGVIGPNGGGKSTLLKAVLGVVPVLSGGVLLFGRPAAARRSLMAYVPQREVVDWDFPVTVADVVMMGRYPRSRWPHRIKREDGRVVEEMLARVDMLAERERQIGQLSGGQQQRVFIARALAQEAEVLLLDEPMTGIDAATREIILKVIEEQSRQGKIVLMATHDLINASGARDCPDCASERVADHPAESMYTPEKLSETFGGPVIVLGQPGSDPRSHAAHHGHVHENLGREHD